MLPPNILITNFCNQNCPFCFARVEMDNKLIRKEMSLKDFKTVLLKLKKNPEIKVVKLLGGEPTLHSKFKDIINLSLKYFSYVQIFTNGIFSDELTKFLIKKSPRIGFTFNVFTPGFMLQPKIRSMVLKRIIQTINHSTITLSLTFDMNSNLKTFFNLFEDGLLKKIHFFRLGFSNPVAGEKNFYQFSDFPKMGGQVVYIIKKIRELNKKAGINLNCGFTRCMFTNKEFKLIKKETNFYGFSCFGKAASFDLQTNLTAFHCFSLSTRYKINTPNKSFLNTYKKLIKKRFEYWKKIRENTCIKCPFYGFSKDKCPGPCLGFLLNS